MKRFGYIPEFPILATAPSTPSANFVKHYYDSTIGCLVGYDSTRSKWLSDLTLTIELNRNGVILAGSSLRTGEGLPTSTTPILIERNICLTGVAISTSALEQFVMRVDDVGSGSGNTLAINYQATGPTTTRNFVKLDLNQNYNANDTLDIYVLSSSSGGISDPRVRLFYRYRV